MRRLLLVVLAMALCSPALYAGAPAGGGRGGRGGRGGGPGGRGGFMGGGGFQFGGQRDQADTFDVARRYFELTPEQTLAIQKLEDQRAAEERKAEAELKATLDKKYVALVMEALPEADKPKYEKAFAALAEREVAVRAAEDELRTAVTALVNAQGVERRGSPNSLPFGKGDIIRRNLKLDEAQHTAIDEIARTGFGTMRDKMGAIQRPQDFNDAAARRTYGEAVRKVREEVDETVAKTMADLLNEAQKAAYQTVATAMDTCRKKVAEAEDTQYTVGKIGFQVHAGEKYKDMAVIVKEVKIRRR